MNRTRERRGVALQDILGRQFGDLDGLENLFGLPGGIGVVVVSEGMGRNAEDANRVSKAHDEVLGQVLREAFDGRVTAETYRVHHTEHHATEKELRKEIDDLRAQLRVAEDKRIGGEEEVRRLKRQSVINTNAIKVRDMTARLQVEIGQVRGKVSPLKLQEAFTRIFDPTHVGLNIFQPDAGCPCFSCVEAIARKQQPRPAAAAAGN